MKSKKILAIVLGIFLTTSIFQTKTNAEINNYNGISKLEQNMNEFSSIRTRSIEINGQKVDLYIEFSEPDEALESFKKKYNDQINFIKNKLNIEELSLSNWDIYYEGIKTLDNLIDEIPDYVLNNILPMQSFFDVFENTDKNNEIILKYGNSLNGRRSFDTEVAQELSLLIPYTSTITTENGKITTVQNIDSGLENNLEIGQRKQEKISTRATYGINLTAARNYAASHAEFGTYDTWNYYNFSPEDCTNFVSQILEAGGISQTSWWWHNRTPSGDPYNPYIHSHSLAWLNADSFCKSWGVSYTTYTHPSFSGKIYDGDIIAYDAGDGDWDHVAFVTYADDYTANYGGKIYYDYKVAQHSKDYHAWTSESRNGWEGLEDYGYTYALIRK